MQVQANGITIELEDSGGAGAPVLLIMGVGGQLMHWPDAFTHPLIAAGYRVIRFDNRDAGLSQHFHAQGKPHLGWIILQRALGLKPRPPYKDSLSLLDAQGLTSAHIAGVSLGGMIAQRMAIAAPRRCLSLSSIMGSSGAHTLPVPHPKVAKVLCALMAKPHTHEPEAVIRYHMNYFDAGGSPGFAPLAPEQLRQLITHTLQRQYDPDGNLRQLAAALADTRHHMDATIPSSPFTATWTPRSAYPAHICPSSTAWATTWCPKPASTCWLTRQAHTPSQPA